MNFYNEFDPAAAAWLRELIARRLIPNGVVDERSISDLKPSDLHGYTQCHFFAGIGGWSLALELAGVDPARPLWTGSCPCQPYSAAGKGLGDADPRNLWPAFFGLIRECRPELVFGEQVADAIGKGWLDRVSADLEGEGYACGATVLGAHSVSAPHIRKRLYWVADAGRGRLDIEQGISREQGGEGQRRDQSADGDTACRLADSISQGLQGHAGHGNGGNQPGRLDALATGSTAEGCATGRLANSPSLPRAQHEREPRGGSRGATGPHDSAERGGDSRRLADPECDDRRADQPERGQEGRAADRRACGGAESGGLGDAPGRGLGIIGDAARPGSGGHADGSGDASCGMAESHRIGSASGIPGPEQGQEGFAAEFDDGRDQQPRGLADADGRDACAERDQRGGEQRREPGDGGGGFWSDSFWLLCRDGKHRRVPTEPALFPLADGLPYKLARRRTVRPALLKGAGNAIVPQVAAEFIAAYFDTLKP